METTKRVSTAELRELIRKGIGKTRRRTVMLTEELSSRFLKLFINFFVKTPEDALALGEKYIFRTAFDDGAEAVFTVSGVGFIPTADNTPYVEAELQKDGKTVQKLPYTGNIWGEYTFTNGENTYYVDFTTFDAKKVLPDPHLRPASASGGFYLESPAYPQ